MNHLRRLGLVVGIAIWVVLAVLLVVHLAHKPANKKVTPNEPCTTTACIQITEQGSTPATFKLNDFRFEPNHCIVFISLPDKVQRNYCGPYRLDWVGPDGSGRGTDV